MKVEANRSVVEHRDSQLHDGFAEAFQDAQRQLAQQSRLSDQELQAFIDSDSILRGLSLDQVRRIFEQRRQFFEEVNAMLSRVDVEYTRSVDPKEVMESFRFIRAAFPIVRREDGVSFCPSDSGWDEVGGNEVLGGVFFGNNTPEGKHVLEIAKEQLSWMDQYFTNLLQKKHTTLLQKEFDILYLFGFIDRRVVLSQEQRELRIAMRTPKEMRSEQQSQLIERFDVR